MINELRGLLSEPQGRDAHKRVVEVLLQVQPDADTNEGEFFQLIAAAYRRIAVSPPDAEWCESVVCLATEARNGFVRQRALYWDLDSLPLQAPELIDVTVEALRLRLLSHDSRASDYAATALLVLGVKWPARSDDISQLLAKPNATDLERANILRLAGAVEAISRKELNDYIDALLAGDPAYSDAIWSLVARHGDTCHWWYLEHSFIARRDLTNNPLNHDHVNALHSMMGYMLVFGRHRAELHGAIESFFTEFINTTVTSGWEHYICRFYDAPLATHALLTTALEGFDGKRNVLLDSSRVKALNRPSHLNTIIEIRQGLWNSAAVGLKQPIIQGTGSDGIMHTTRSMAKESALILASRIALPELASWEVYALREEKAPFLIQRMAEDCMYWGESSFVFSLADAMQVAGSANPIWLIGEACGSLDPNCAFDILLRADGRVGDDDVLQTYADTLGYLAASEGTCARLTRSVADNSQPLWRRRACVYAVGRALCANPEVDIDWGVVSTAMLDPTYPEWCRDPLAVEIATHHPDRFGDLARTAGTERLQSTRFSLACVLVGVHTTAVLERLEVFRATKVPDAAPFGDPAYAALCIGHLYNQRVVDSGFVIEYCIGGLRAQIEHVFRAIQTVRDDDLCGLLQDAVIERNSSWASLPGLWKLLGHHSPDRLSNPEIRARVAAAPASSVRAYLGALTRFPPSDLSNEYSFLVELSLTRDRSIAWHAARAAARLGPASLDERIGILCNSGELGIRSACEHYMWSNEWDVVKAHEIASMSQFTSAHEYVEELDEVKHQVMRAHDYVELVIVSQNLLDDWLYVQAILASPSEDALELLRHYIDVRRWSPEVGRAWYLRNFLAKNMEKKLKETREKLWNKSRLPGEGTSARWS